MSKFKVGFLSLATILTLSACANNTETGNDTESPQQSEEVVQESNDEGHEMEHDESGELPEGITEATNPTYDVGETVTLTTDHMPGMEGAEAQIVGAFDTTAYGVTYEDSETGELVENHKWVVQEELTEVKNQNEPLETGAEVTIEAYHMPGMEGQTATIDEVEGTTVYMVDYLPTDGSEAIQNHKWVVEGEIEPAE